MLASQEFNMHTRLICGVLAGVVSTTVPVAADVMAPANERFASADTTEVPDFQQHVVPLLGRLGCNGRSCHGSFQGRGGFRLSLFGYDFKMDHGGLTAKATSENGLRIDRSSPGESLILQKPSPAIDHEGGQRFKPGSWEHNLLLRWVEASTKGVREPRELDHWRSSPRKLSSAIHQTQRSFESSPSGKTVIEKTSLNCVAFARMMTALRPSIPMARFSRRDEATRMLSRFTTTVLPLSRSCGRSVPQDWLQI